MHRHFDRRVLRIRQRDSARRLFAVDVKVPGRPAALHLQPHLIKLSAEGDELIHFEVGTAKQLFGAAARVFARIALGQCLPRGNVQF